MYDAEIGFLFCDFIVKIEIENKQNRFKITLVQCWRQNLFDICHSQ